MLGSNPCMNNNIQIGFLTNILTILIFIFHDGLNTKLIIRLVLNYEACTQKIYLFLYLTYLFPM